MSSSIFKSIAENQSAYKQAYNKDYSFGMEQEQKVLEIIKTHYNDGSICKTCKRHPYDFYSKKSNTYYELKSRHNFHDAYPTTMIPYSKIEYIFRNIPAHYVFLFQFKDGLYYIEYDKELFDTFETKVGGRYDRNKVELNHYVYIPIERIKPIML